MKTGLSFTIVARGEGSTTLEVVYYTTKATGENVSLLSFTPGEPTVEIEHGLDG